ncbi:MAG: YqgE/AlgH family protein [Gammaproteobacteria bacterium]|nr:YqgE/AlgH family protein [Gammaproteobacteria bacterium]
MGEMDSLANQFLIAMPNLADPNFSRTVTLICEHSSQGAMGLIINRPTDLSLREILHQMDIEIAGAAPLDLPVHLGGPVQGNRGFVVHEPLGNWESTLPVSDTLGVSTSRDILVALAQNRGPRRSFLALGYAGWAPGQLEREIAENAWLSGPADRSILFDMPAEQRWGAAAHLLGIDLAALSEETGHA